MTSSDIGDILFLHCSTLSVKDVQRGWNFTKGEVATERVTVTVKPVSGGRAWGKAYAEINVCVPDLPDGDADLIRLAELEREYVGAFGINVGRKDGVNYRFKRESAGMLDDASLRLHYINIRVLFEFQNTIEQWQVN